MTNRERAKKILKDWFATSHQYKVPKKKLADLIASELDEAFDDGYKTGYGDRHETVEKISAEGFADGIEKAAEAVPTGWLDDLLSGKNAPKNFGGAGTESLLRSIAKRIRALKADR